MTSKERMLAAIACEPVDYTPCSFMIFFNMYCRTGSITELVERQAAMGLDACAHVGHLEPALHPDARCAEWTENREGQNIFCRRIDTPKGPLTARYQQCEGWPRPDYFPFFNDWLIPRAEEVLVKPEQAVIEALRTLGPGSGFILSPVDNVREDTERTWRNTHVFVETWKKHRIL